MMFASDRLARQTPAQKQTARLLLQTDAWPSNSGHIAWGEAAHLLLSPAADRSAGRTLLVLGRGVELFLSLAWRRRSE